MEIKQKRCDYMKIKYYVREYISGKYFISKIKPYIPNNKSPTIGDIFYDRWADYIVTNIENSGDEFLVYMDKKRLSLPRKYSWYECKNNNEKGD